MSLYAVSDTRLTAIAEAIREKDGLGAATVDEMPERIRALPGGGTDVITMDFKTFDIEIPTASQYYRIPREKLSELPAYIEFWSLEDTMEFNRTGSSSYWVVAGFGLVFQTSSSSTGTAPQTSGVIVMPSKLEKTWNWLDRGATYTATSAPNIGAYKDTTTTVLTGSMQSLAIRNATGSSDANVAGLKWSYDPREANPIRLECASSSSFLRGRYRVIWR